MVADQLGKDAEASADRFKAKTEQCGCLLRGISVELQLL